MGIEATKKITPSEINRRIGEYMVPNWRDLKTGDFEELNEFSSTHTALCLTTKDYSQLKYHKSWDATIPVIRKIRKSKAFRETEIIPENFGDAEIIAGLYILSLDLVCTGILMFLDWLETYENEQKNER